MEFIKAADQMKNLSSSRSVELKKAKITAMEAEAMCNKLSYLSSNVIKNENFNNPPKRQILFLEDCNQPSPSNDQVVKRGRHAKGKIHSAIGRMNKYGERMDKFAHSILQHVRLGHKISETLKGKLRRIGGKINLQGGGAKAFKHNFDVREGEMLLKASQCYLSTTAGPIAGLLFISTDKVAFCSNRSVIELKSPAGKMIGIRYKVAIPVPKIKRVYESSNVKKPSEKYIQVVTQDNFEFWFMGFLNHQSMLRRLQQTLL